jgi:hypothetical protein
LTFPLAFSDKIDTLCLLVQRIIEENNHLKSEIVVVGDQCDKQREAKEAIKTLNQAYKKQVTESWCIAVALIQLSNGGGRTPELVLGLWGFCHSRSSASFVLHAPSM